MVRRGEGKFACLSKEQSPRGLLNAVSLPQENLQKLVHIEHSVRGQSGLLQPGRVSAAGRPTLIRALFPASYVSDCVDGQISGVYRCCLLSYCDKELGALLCVKNHHSGSAQRDVPRVSGWERQALPLLLHRKAIWLFTPAVLSHPMCSVFWWNCYFPPYILLLKGCNTSRNRLQPGKAQSFIWLGKSLKSGEIICFQFFILTISQWCF